MKPHWASLTFGAHCATLPANRTYSVVVPSTRPRYVVEATDPVAHAAAGTGVGDPHGASVACAGARLARTKAPAIRTAAAARRIRRNIGGPPDPSMKCRPPTAPSMPPERYATVDLRDPSVTST